MFPDFLIAPIYRDGQAVSVTTSAQAVVLNSKATSICLTNTGAGNAYVRVGGTDVAIPAGYLIMAGTQVVISKPDNEDRMTIIGDAATDVHVICGRGA